MKVAVKDSDKKFLHNLSLNFMVMPDYVSSFNNAIEEYVRDGTKNLGEGIRFGVTAEYKYTKRSALRLGIDYYYENSNFEIFSSHSGVPIRLNGSLTPWDYFYKSSESGIEFPIEYKYTFINKKIKLYFVTGLVFSYFYRQDNVIISNGDSAIKNQTITINRFQQSYLDNGAGFYFVLFPGINYSISDKVRLYVEPSFRCPFGYVLFDGLQAPTSVWNQFVPIYLYYLSVTVGINYKL